MFTELVINVTEHETRVALLEDGTIVELFVDRKDESNIAGNIYKGRVQRVLPGMQAAFVDIGLNQAAFIHVRDVIGGVHQEYEGFFLENEEEAEPLGDAPILGEKPNGNSAKSLLIEEMLSEGQEILVQVSKSPLGSKGARVTSHVSLPGRFLVLMPTSEHVGISRRIEDETERKRLKNTILELKNDTFGYIARTVSEGLPGEKIYYEMNFLKNLWEKIQGKYRRLSAPALLHQELSVVLRAVRDLFTHEADKLVIDSRFGYESVLSFLDEFMPNLKDSIELYEGSEPIFDAYNLEGDISRALKKKVWLKSGGYIVMENCEALVAIDVNTGRYVGKHNLEETILKTNLEAVKEIAYQIRLRDLGGIIIIDFIDMEKVSNQEKVFNALKEAFKKDRSKTHVLPISELGLVQMTRKRIRKPLNRMLCEPCFYCEGEGYLMSRQSICYNIYREVIRDSGDIPGKRLTLMVNPEIAERLHGEENHIILSLEQALGKSIIIYPNQRYHMEEYEIIEQVK
jgi:ribonuclease G